MSIGGGKGENVTHAGPSSPTVKRMSSFRNSQRISAPSMGVVSEEDLDDIRNIEFGDYEPTSKILFLITCKYFLIIF